MLLNRMSLFRNLLCVSLLFALVISQDSVREKRVAVHDDAKDENGNNGDSYPFPIVIPPYIYDRKLSNDTFGNCLLYIESISVVVYAQPEQTIGNKRDFYSAAAVIERNNSKFVFNTNSVNCFNKDNIPRATDGSEKIDPNFDFRVKVNFDSEIVAVDDKADGDKKQLFSISDGIDLRLKFNYTSDISWRLTDVELLSDIDVKSKGWLKESVKISAGEASDNANRLYFGGFGDYSYACSSTPAIAWTDFEGLKKKKDTKDFVPKATVGIVFNNLQVQAYGITVAHRPSDDGNKDKENITYRFSSNVNDCQGTFSVGSWMAIIVILLLLAVLSFGFLMLNSVQTMDRFDDPKQKQLIINAKD